MSSYSPAGRQSAAGRIAAPPAPRSSPRSAWRRTIVALDEWLTAAARARPDHPAVVADGACSPTRSSTRRRRAARAGWHARRGRGRRGGHDACRRRSRSASCCTRCRGWAPRWCRSTRGRRARHRRGLRGVGAADGRRRREVELREQRGSRSGAHGPLHLRHHRRAQAGRADLRQPRGERRGLAPSARRGRRDRWLCPLPLFHVGGLAILIRVGDHRTTAVLHERFDVERVNAALEDGEVTLVSLVPTHARAACARPACEAPGLRAMLLGGGPIPPDLLEWAARHGIPVTPIYGMTETARRWWTDVPRARRCPAPSCDRAPTARSWCAGRWSRAARSPPTAGSTPATAAASTPTGGCTWRADQGPDRDRRGERRAGRGRGGATRTRRWPTPPWSGLPRPGVGRGGDGVRGRARRRGPGGAARLLPRAAGRHQVPKRVVRVDELPRNAAGKLLRDRLASTDRVSPR